METFPPELVVVPFDEGKTDGDSTFNTAIVFPYMEGMTLKDLQKITLEYFMKEFGIDDGVYESTEEFAEDEGIKIIGGWVVDAITHDLINNIIVDCGNDSACYAVNRVQKSQIEKASRFLIGGK